MTEQHHGPGRPTSDQSAQITDRIVYASWQVLLDVGPEHFTVNRIAPVAHASKQTIYARFTGKLDLLQTVLASRCGMIFVEMLKLTDTDDIQLAFTDLARRAVRSLTEPEVRMVDRLVDWIDSNLAEGSSFPTRSAVYGQLHEQVSRHLFHAMEHWAIIIDDVPSAAAFWLDGLIGHIRGLPLEGVQWDEWPSNYTRYFLRAVCQVPQDLGPSIRAGR